MSKGNVDTASPRTPGAWFTIVLLAVIVGIELAFPSWSAAQMAALGVAAVFFGAILAWCRFR